MYNQILEKSKTNSLKEFEKLLQPGDIVMTCRKGNNFWSAVSHYPFLHTFVVIEKNDKKYILHCDSAKRRLKNHEIVVGDITIEKLKTLLKRNSQEKIIYKIYRKKIDTKLFNYSHVKETCKKHFENYSYGLSFGEIRFCINFIAQLLTTLKICDFNYTPITTFQIETTLRENNFKLILDNIWLN